MEVKQKNSPSNLLVTYSSYLTLSFVSLFTEGLKIQIIFFVLYNTYFTYFNGHFLKIRIIQN